MSTLFISHSCHGETDNALAANMRDWLKSQGHESYFLDFDPDKGFGPGIRWEDELYRNLRQCRAVIALLTPDWLTSRWCFAEVTQARAQGKPVFLVEAIRCDGAGMFDDVQHVDLVTDPEDGYRRLAAGLKQVGIDPADAFHWDGSRPPYPGLLAFDREDAAVFFGRDRDIQRGLEKLDSLRRAGRPLFLLLLGASGSGKSSVLRAGLLPRLAKDPRSWLPVTPFRPQDDPLEEMAVKLARASADAEHQRDWKAVLQTLTEGDPGQGLGTLARDLQVAVNRDDATVLLAVDQFEELFGYTDAAKAGAFLGCVRGALAGGGRRLMVVATMRSDSLAAFQTHPDLQDFDYETLTIDPMPQRDFPEIIEGPARLADIALEPGLTQALINDAGTGEALPLLAFTLRELYERYGDDRLLEIKEYKALGRLEGAVRGGAEGIIEDAKPGEAELTALREAFVPAMVRVNPEGEFMRRRALWFDLPPRAQPLLQRFVEARLLVSRGEGGERVVEVSHEALFRSWPRLEGWLREDRDSLRVFDDLLRDAEVWENSGRAPGWLNHHGERLAAVCRLQQEAHFAQNFGSVERDYFEVCKVAERRREEELQRAFRTARSNESRALSALSANAFQQGHHIDAVKLALASWPRSITDTRPMLRSTIVNLGSAFLAQRQNLPSMRHGAPVIGAVFTADESRILTRSEDGTARLWDATTSRPIGEPMRHEKVVLGAVFSADESRILTRTIDGTTRLWDAVTTRPVGEPMRHDGTVLGFRFSADECRILTWTIDGTIRLWDAVTTRPIGEPMRHDKSVSDAVFSADESRILTWSDDGTARLWDAATTRPVGEPMRHEDPVLGAHFSADESRILTWSWDGTARLWDVAATRLIGEPMRHDESVSGAVFSADESRILTWSGRLMTSSGLMGSGGDGTARLWDATTTRPIGEPMRHEDDIVGAVFTADESRILTWSDDGTARLWDAVTTRPVGEPMRHDGTVLGVRFSANERRILTRSSDGTARLWDAATTRLIGEPMRIGASVSGAIFSADERRIRTWSWDGTAGLWDAATTRPIGEPMRLGASVSGAVFSADERRILTWSDDGTARLWDVATIRPIGEPMRHEKFVEGAIFSADESRILTWSGDGTARLWDATTTRPICEPMRLGASVSGAVFSADERRILTWSSDGTARLWDATIIRPIGKPMRHDDLVSGAIFSADESRILTWSGNPMALRGDGTARLWDVATTRPIGEPMRHEKFVLGAVFSADERRILTWSWDGTARLWDAATTRPIGEPMRHEDGIVGAVYTADESRILTWSSRLMAPGLMPSGRDGTARLWDATTTRPIGEPTRHEDGVVGAVFSADESRILTWSDDGRARLWDATTTRPIGEPMRHEDGVVGAVFTADESRILTWSGDGTAQLWDAATTRPICEPMRHEDGVVGAVFSADESRILTWSDDGRARLWNATTSRPIGEPMRHEDGVVGAVFTADECRILTWSDDGTARLWDAATTRPIGEPMRHDKTVSGAVFTADESRILTWSDDGTARLWDVLRLVKGTLFELACKRLPDHDLSELTEKYGIKIEDPICAESPPSPDWSRIE